MKNIRLLVVFLMVVLTYPGGVAAQDGDTPSESSKALQSGPFNGLTPLSSPYVISTAPRFAIWVQFPPEDSIRRIALGDSSYFLAEADQEDPHYAIVKQIKVANARRRRPVESNMLVYMASGKVINVKLRTGGIDEMAYLIDYPVPKPEPQEVLLREPRLSPAERERLVQEQTVRLLVEEMFAEAKDTPKKDNASVAGGLALHLYRMERVDDLALVSFDVENLTSRVVDLVGPQLNLVTVAEKKKRGKKNTALNIEPVPLLEARLSPRHLSPGERAVGVVQFNPPVHDSNQQVVLAVANRAMADRAAQVQIE